MLRRAIGALTTLIAPRENEYDDVQPGPARPMTGLFHQLAEKQKHKVLSYKGPEYIGGPKRKILA